MSDTFAMEPGTDLTGKVAVILGAARDVGLALALYAADRGMRVALADENEYLLAAALEQVKAKEVEAIAVPSDMLDLAAVCELARRSATQLGPPWLVCNNPGVSIEVTLWGIINSVQVFAPGMVERDGGHIVNIAAAEVLGTRGAAPDAAIRHAIVGLSESLYRERSRIPEFRCTLDALRSAELPAPRRGCRADLRRCRRAELLVSSPRVSAARNVRA